MKLSKAYEPKKVEDKIYRFWEKSGYFNPNNLPKARKKPYSIVIPLPNITGALHMGHALNASVQDILIRWKRLQGYKCLWLPGTDHAGIAAQNVVEKELKKQGLTRFDIGREKLIEKIWEWKKKYGDIILEQLKKMGSSCDWSRTRFTLDKEYQKAVEKAFLHYYKKHWVYQGERVVNWCVRCQTSLSDLEIEYKEEKGHLWYIKYPIKKSSITYSTSGRLSNMYKQNKNTKYIVVATTRPETMLGDTAVAVNPNDKRYKNLDRQKVILPLVNQEIPIIADRIVDPKFGTGAVKVTPAHDLCDYEIGLRHKLKNVQVIDETGKLNKQAPLPYQGLKISDAREKIIQDLKNLGLLEKIEDYAHQVPKCYRCGRTIELIPSQQWFLKMDELAKLAMRAVETGKVKFHPKKWEKVYFRWLKNVRDWCISRQIWWGHRIPLKGETDVLDTWFSSALWPFAALGWPKKTKDLKTFYPTNILSTDRGIINLWVTRMIFSGAEFMKKEPFRDVYIHATVLTKEGKRMSKSLGTGINPMGLIEKYGADATRFGIIWQVARGQDMCFTEDNIVMGKKFCNKVWNASRFVLQQSGNSKSKIQNSKKLTKADKRILKQLNKTIKFIDKDLENFQFGKAARCLYNFFWHDFCDVYIEEFKNFQQKNESQQTLFYVLLTSLKLLHPFMPFITEEIYQKLPMKNKKKCLMIEKWPT
jgi:valyl-tRNA synthetase